MAEQFRITTWPPFKVGVPEVQVGWDIEIEDRAGEVGGPFLIFPHWSMPHWAAPPDELYLRELQALNVRDVDLVADFCRRYGRFGTYDFSEIELDDIDPRSKWPGQPLPCLQRVRALREAYEVWEEARYGSWTSVYVDSLEAIALYVGLVRDMTRVWRFHQGQLSYEDVLDQMENQLWIETKEVFGDIAPMDPSGLLYELRNQLSPALRSYHVGMEIEEESEPRVHGPSHTLYSALCLQLVNHMTEGAKYRECLRCGGIFVRQKGRSEYGQNRTAGRVDYCSKECANAAMQSRYRDKKRKVRRLQAEGLTPSQIATRLGEDLETVERWLTGRADGKPGQP